MNKKLTILIIDDNIGDQMLLQENLQSTGLIIDDIVMADTLAKGMECLENKKFSLVFLDLFLPDSSGLDSLSQLSVINSKTAIIIYSGVSDTSVALKAISYGAQDFLIKGDYSVSLLEKAVRYSIERRANLDELEKSNERYNLVSKATNDMVWDWDLITGNVHRNVDGWKKLFRTSIDKEIGTRGDWEAKIHPDDRSKALKVIDELTKSYTKDFFDIEFRILRDDNTIGYIQDRGYISRNDKGQGIRIIGASHDITERKLAEEKVILSEQRFKSLVQNGADIVTVIDVKGNFTYVSPTSKTILGYDPEYLLGKNASGFIHPDDIENTTTSLKNALNDKFIKVPHFRFINADKQWRWIESTITNLLDEPSVNGIVVNSRDITEKKLADDEIERLSLVAKETINGIIISDIDQNIIWVNNAFTRIFGYELEEVLGKNPGAFLIGPQTDKEEVNAIQQKTKYSAEPFSFEMQCFSKAGNKLYVSVVVQPIFDKYGNVKQTFALQTDITEKRRLEETVELEKVIKQKQITDAVFEAQESERSEIGRELHDNVNQLLGATRLYIDMAKTDEINRQSLLVNASTFTLTAIDEIRKLSKTLITPSIKEIGLIDSVDDLTQEIMLVHPIQIVFTADHFNEEGLSDKFKLNIFRIIQEQINNILKHAHAKSIEIIMEDNEGDIFISIIDNGIGFDTTVRKAGVGLTNIKSRSELFNGVVQLISTPGNGTTLSLTFNKATIPDT